MGSEIYLDQAVHKKTAILSGSFFLQSFFSETLDSFEVANFIYAQFAVS